jgi:hypothetical protein
MKKIILVSLILLCKLSSPELKANPIILYPPQAFISEVFIPGFSQWTIELEIYIPYYWLSGNNIDSIVIQSNSGRSKLLSFPVTGYDLVTINSDSLAGPLTFNPSQDTIRVLTYINPEVIGYGFEPVYTHQLVFGYANCEIPLLNSGQSICTREKQMGNPLYFYLDNSPTMGGLNDTIGATSTIHGKFYDCRDNQITFSLNDHSFVLSPNVEEQTYPDYPWWLFFPLSQFEFDDQGSFTTKVLSRNATINKVENLECNGCYYGTRLMTDLPCTPFSYNLEPGQTQEQNIHLSDSSFLVGYSDKTASSGSDITIVCAPNPVVTSTRIFITSVNSLKNMELKIFDVQGKLMKAIALPDEQKASIGITKADLGEAGTYVYTVFGKNIRLKSGFIICQ